MCLAQGPQRSDAGEAWTRGPSVSSQALYHCAPAAVDVDSVVVIWVIRNGDKLCLLLSTTSYKSVSYDEIVVVKKKSDK